MQDRQHPPRDSALPADVHAQEHAELQQPDLQLAAAHVEVVRVRREGPAAVPLRSPLAIVRIDSGSLPLAQTKCTLQSEIKVETGLDVQS